MDRSVASKRKRKHLTLLSACMVMGALLLMPILRSQEEDEAHLRSKAMALEQQGTNREAEQVWDRIAKTDPQNAEALAHLGLLEARQEHYDTAIDYYRRAVVIKSDLPGLQMNLGLALFKAAQFPDAIKTFSAEIRRRQQLGTLASMDSGRVTLAEYVIKRAWLLQGD